MEQDIEDLKKKTDYLNSDLNYFKTEYEYEEKHEKHGALERELAKGRKEDPELMELLDEWRDKQQDAFDALRKKRFLEDGKYTEKDWKEFNKEVEDAKRKVIHKKHA